MTTSIKWFSDSPDAGTPECICSKCGLVINDNDDDPPPIRVWNTQTGEEARFHLDCFKQILKSIGSA